MVRRMIQIQKKQKTLIICEFIPIKIGGYLKFCIIKNSTHLKLCLATMNHNFKWLNIFLISDQIFANPNSRTPILFLLT